MRLNRTSEWKVMTIWISRELPLFNLERLDILCAWFRNQSEKLWPLELLKCFRCSISSISIYYAPESDILVKSYEHLDLSRASVVQSRPTWYIIWLNRTSEWKVMTFWISQDLLWFNFEHSIYYVPESHIPGKSYDHLNFSRVSVVQFRASRYVMRQNQTSELKVMTIWISRELMLFNFELLDMWCAWIGHPSEKFMIIWISRELPLFNFDRLDMWCAWIGHPSLKLWPFEYLGNFHCSISSVSIYYAPESDLRVKRYDHLNFSELPLFNFERLDMWCAWIRHLMQKLWPFEFL